MVDSASPSQTTSSFPSASQGRTISSAFSRLPNHETFFLHDALQARHTRPLPHISITLAKLGPLPPPPPQPRHRLTSAQIAKRTPFSRLVICGVRLPSYEQVHLPALPLGRLVPFPCLPLPQSRSPRRLFRHRRN